MYLRAIIINESKARGDDLGRRGAEVACFQVAFESFNGV
jgi:hypothetical protein